MYDSPIKIDEMQLETSLENEVLTAIRKVHVTVDKEELLRALRYDREQYEQGYRDAIRDKGLEEVVRCKDCEYTCPVGNGLVCTIWCAGTEPDTFCSRGERKDDGR